VTAATSRPDRLSAAAIAVIARSGLRGLTHRAVDVEAGLPEGSTSYYYRTRLALLVAVTERIARDDLAEAPDEGGMDLSNLDQIADLTAGIVAHWVGPGRDRMLARYEISLQASRQPELRETLTAAGTGMRTTAAAFLRAAGAPDPVRQGRDLLSCIDGLIYDQIAGVGGPRPHAEVRATVREILRGMVGR
jgi:DNA-binding transcriptional regulator YbjK